MSIHMIQNEVIYFYMNYGQLPLCSHCCGGSGFFQFA